MTTTQVLTTQEKEFLEKCEEELKDRYTENDEEFMKIYNMEPSEPPIVEPWYVNRRRNDNRFNRRGHPYQSNNRQGRDNYRNRDDYHSRDNYHSRNDYHSRDNYNRRHRGYNSGRQPY